MKTDISLALDTNVLAYAEGVNGLARKTAALDLLQKLPPRATLVPVQVLGELFALLVRKAKRSRRDASAAVLSWGDAFPLIESSGEMLLAALTLAETHHLGLWDALILSAAAEARCRLLLSEDLRDGFTWRGVTVTNPFGPAPHPMLAAVLTE